MLCRLIVSTFFVASSIAMPYASQAAVYTFNVPVKLSSIAAPKGTTFTVVCIVSPTDSAPSYYAPNQVYGQVKSPPLNADGSSSGTVTVAITIPPAGAAMKSYVCGFYQDPGNPLSLWNLLPNSGPTSAQFNQSLQLANPVSGKIP
jgi:hypothetical protein